MKQKKLTKYLLLIYFLNIGYFLSGNDNREKGIMQKKEKGERFTIEIPPTEDLMREHGILNRVLLIYEEILKRINNNDFQISALNKAVDIIKSFIEDYHEKLEENYIFPIFEKAKKETRLVKTLRNQHNKGRQITEKLKNILSMKDLEGPKRLTPQYKRTIKSLLNKFIYMYRPHEAREDTVLFPKVRDLISEAEFKELGETFEDLEHKLFGEEGFQAILKKVESIEKELGIYKLEQFTPIINDK